MHAARSIRHARLAPLALAAVLAITSGGSGCGEPAGHGRDAGARSSDGAAGRDGATRGVDGAAAENRPPMWISGASLSFVIGSIETVGLASRVMDPDGDPVAITLAAGTLAGVSFDPAEASLHYDGSAPERAGSLTLRATDARGAATDRIFDVRIGARGPLCSTFEWDAPAYGEVTVLDHEGEVIHQGHPRTHIPWGSKHTRMAYRPADGRVYVGFGDYGLRSGPSGLPDQIDTELQSAQPAFFSFDPTSPMVLTKEQGSYITDPARIQHSGADEGGADWDTTRDRLLLSPVDAFADFTGTGAPDVELVGPTTLRVGPGDVTASYLPDTRIGLHIDHPRAGEYIQQGRVVTARAEGGSTVLEVLWHDDDIDLASAIVTGISIAHKNPRGAWMITARSVYHESTDTEHAVLLAWDPETREWSRLLFTPLYAPDPTTWRSWATKNLRFVPASATGRHDEVHALSSLGGHFVTYILDLEDQTIDRVRPGLALSSGAIDQVTTAFDGERSIYTFDIGAGTLIRWDVRARTVERLSEMTIDGETFARERLPDKTWVVFDDSARLVHIVSRRDQEATDGSHLFVYDPRDDHYELCGTTLPDGSPITARAMVRAGDRTVLDGGSEPAQRQMLVSRR